LQTGLVHPLLESSLRQQKPGRLGSGGGRSEDGVSPITRGGSRVGGSRHAELARGNRAGYEAACVIMADRVTPAAKSHFSGMVHHRLRRPQPAGNSAPFAGGFGSGGVPSGPSVYKGDREGAYYAALGALTMRLGRHQKPSNT
jgi:hypothetical protein